MDMETREDMGMKTITEEFVKAHLAPVQDIKQNLEDKLSDDDKEQFSKMGKETESLLCKCVEIAYNAGFRDGVDTGIRYEDCEEKSVYMEKEQHAISVEDMTDLLTIYEAYQTMIVTLIGEETILGYDKGCLGAMTRVLAVIENNASKDLKEEDIDDIVLDISLEVEEKARKLLGMEL